MAGWLVAKQHQHRSHNLPSHFEAASSLHAPPLSAQNEPTEKVHLTAANVEDEDDEKNEDSDEETVPWPIFPGNPKQPAHLERFRRNRAVESSRFGQASNGQIMALIDLAIVNPLSLSALGV
jgi:hypothetical protein